MGGFGSGMHRAQMMDGTPGPGNRMGMRGQMGGPQQSLVAVAADTLGMTQADLIAQLQGGKTIAQVASEKNVALDTIVNAFVATRQAHMAQAVAAGRMTQEQADAMLATMRANVTARLSQPWSPRGQARASPTRMATGYATTPAAAGWAAGRCADVRSRSENTTA